MTKNDFDELWRWAEDELESLWEQEKSIVASLPEKHRNVLFSRLSLVYLRYIVVARQLDVCYRNMLHVQKRRDISTIIRAVLGRVVELKNELAVLDFNETPFIGTALAQLKLSPEQVDPPLTIFIDGSAEDSGGNGSSRSQTQSECKEIVERVLLKLERNPRRQLSSEATAMTWDEAVALIQIHERARQGRLRFNLMKQIRAQKMMASRGLNKLKPAMNPSMAASKIQSAWRSYLALQRVRQLRHSEMVFLGMVSGNTTSDNPEIIRAKELEAMRSRKQSELEAQYKEALAKHRDRIRDKDGAAIRETFLSQIRRWYTEQHESNGKFPDLPAEEEGGSKIIYSKPDRPAEIPVPVVVKKDTAPTMTKSSNMKRAEDDKPKGVDMAQSLWLDTIVHENQKYYDIWRDRAGSSGNGTGWDLELLRAQVKEELDEEMRIEADEQARSELERLRSAYDRDRGRKSKGKRKTARKATKKAKRGRKEKDLTPDRTLESLVEELVQVGIIRSYPKANIDDFLGSVSVVDPMSRRWKRDTFPGMGDIRSAIIEYCILSLGSDEIRNRTPLTRSVLLAGPHGSGKTFLINAICNHTGATLFDISNSALMGRYPGKAGMTMLIHLITKVSRLLQPSVILIEDVDRLFMKKSARMERWDMRRMRKELPKILRAIVPEDRVLLVGTSSTAWECDQRNLSQCFQRMIGIPPPEYGTRYTLWEKFIEQATRSQYSPTPCELTNLARVSDTYTPGSIARCVAEILSDRRKSLLSRQPLKAEEFVSALARCEPVYKEDEENLRLWYGKTPLRRKRHRNADAEEDEFLADGKGKEKKKKKKKKKGSKKSGVKSTKAKRKK